MHRADHLALPAQRAHHPGHESRRDPGYRPWKPDLKDQVGIALQRLYAWQNPDGGWGWWSGEKSDPLTSAYVVLGLIEAQEAGYTVDAGVLERGAELPAHAGESFIQV